MSHPTTNAVNHIMSVSHCLCLQIMKKSILKSDLEKQHQLPPCEESVRQLKKQRRVSTTVVPIMLCSVYSQEITVNRMGELLAK